MGVGLDFGTLVSYRLAFLHIGGPRNHLLALDEPRLSLIIFCKIGVGDIVRLRGFAFFRHCGHNSHGVSCSPFKMI